MPGGLRFDVPALRAGQENFSSTRGRSKPILLGCRPEVVQEVPPCSQAHIERFDVVRTGARVGSRSATGTAANATGVPYGDLQNSPSAMEVELPRLRPRLVGPDPVLHQGRLRRPRRGIEPVNVPA